MKDDRSQKLKKQKAYAQSILYNAIRLGGIEEAVRVRTDLSSILSASINNAEISNMFRDEIAEVYNETSKVFDIKSFIYNVFAGASKIVLETLCVMAEYRDLSLCMGMYKIYNELLEEKYDVTIIDVTTAVELDDNLRTLIKNKFQNDIDRKIVLHEHIKKNILGGVIIEANERIIDCSLLTILERAKSELTSAHRYE